MSEKRFRKARALEYGNMSTRPAERCLVLHFRLDDNRPAESRLEPSAARFLANRLLLSLRENFPEAAECPHIMKDQNGTCQECGARNAMTAERLRELVRPDIAMREPKKAE